jgi:hypothetical protein
MPEAQRAMPEGISPEDLNPVANKQEAQGLWADGKRMFALNEMDEKLTPITSKAMLDSYSADAIGWMEPQTPTRFMPEGVDEDKFYSQLERVITDKVPTRATTQQIINSLGEYIVTKTETIDGKDKTTVVGKFPYTEQSKAKSLAESVERGRSDWSSPSKVKDDEIKWSGIEQALASLEKDGKVSKEDLLNYLRNEGAVRFEEVKSDVGMSMGSQNFSVHVLPGGENYREVVLAMPKTSGYTLRNGKGDIVGTYQNREEALVELKQLKDSDYLANITPTDEVSGYTTNHFPNIPNYVAHMRTNERVDEDGRPGLFVEEFQSDRHQAGRKQGYDDKKENGLDVATREFNSIVKPYSPATPSEVQQLVLGNLPSDTEWARNALGDNFERIRDLAKQDMRGIQDAPFRTTWPIQLFKRALRDAVDGGKDWIGWTVGDTQNERFDLSKQVDSISVPMVNADGSRSVRIDPKEGTSFKMMVDSNGIVNGYQSADQFTGKRLDEVVGKDMADKIIALESPANFEGNDLKVGGSGMRGFYDNMLPKEVGKYIKQFGGKVEKAEIDIREPASEAWYKEPTDNDYKPIWKVNITPEMRKISQTGQMRFMPEDYRGTHTAPTSESAPAHDLTGNGVYPADVYTRPDWYEQDAGLEEMKKIKRLKGNPNASITIYRAVPVEVAEEARKTGSPSKYVFRSGDWVTTSKQYAKDHGDSALQEKYRIFSKSVKAKDIYTDGNSIFEWGYNPAMKEEKTQKSKTKGNASAIANAAKLK